MLNNAADFTGMNFASLRRLPVEPIVELNLCRSNGSSKMGRELDLWVSMNSRCDTKLIN